MASQIMMIIPDVTPEKGSAVSALEHLMDYPFDAKSGVGTHRAHSPIMATIDTPAILCVEAIFNPKYNLKDITFVVMGPDPKSGEATKAYEIKLTGPKVAKSDLVFSTAKGETQHKIAFTYKSIEINDVLSSKVAKDSWSA